MLFKIVRCFLFVITVSSPILGAAELDLFETLLNSRKNTLKIKLDSNEFVDFSYDAYNGLEFDNPLDRYFEYFSEKNLQIDDYFKFIDIKGGTFNMGSPKNERGRCTDENQIPNLMISKFSMQTTQVTQFQYWLVTNSNPSHFMDKKHCPTEHVTLNGVSMCPNHPVEQVSWDDAQIFIEALNSMSEAYTYDLPSEAEWEYAARAGTTTAYSFGDNTEDLASYAWFIENSKKQTHQVASLKPNKFGLSDMHGNVWEWVKDNWSSKFYRFVTRIHPIFKNSGSLMVIRGGWWNSNAQNLRSAIRSNGKFSNRGDGLGLRLVRTPN